MTLAATALGLLLDDANRDLDLEGIDWPALIALAERRGVIVRIADAVLRRGRSEDLPPELAPAAARAAARTQQVLALVDALGAACRRLGIAHAFLKTAEGYPDSGPDIDLLIAEPSPRVDRAILKTIPAAIRGHGFRHRLGGSRTYTATLGLVIDLHHGRLGQFGEQARYARILLSRARPLPVGFTTCVAPSAEDHFLLLATQQAYTRPAVRISDVYGAIELLRRRDQLNWDYIFATALSMDVLPLLGVYLGYVNRMHMQVLNQSLLPHDFLARFTGEQPVPAADDLGARFRLYLHHISATLEAGRWHSIARLLMLPLVAALAAGPRR